MTETTPEAMRIAEEPADFLVRKGGYFYRPKSQGYTSSALEAGRYTLEQAVKETHPNGPNGPRDGLTFHHYSEFPQLAAASIITEALAEKNARIAELEAALDDIKQECLAAGAPGQRTSAKAFAHIVRLCLNARAALESTNGQV